jgi:hypothetical protein
MSHKNVGPVVKAHDPLMRGNSKSLADTFKSTASNRGHSTPGQSPKVSTDDLLRSRAPKNHAPVAYANHVTPRQMDAAGMGGMGHSTDKIQDGGQVLTQVSAAAPMAHAYGGGLPKNHDRPVATTWGHRDRANDHSATGKQNFSAKTLSPDERHALGRAIRDNAAKSGGYC